MRISWDQNLCELTAQRAGVSGGGGCSLLEKSVMRTMTPQLTHSRPGTAPQLHPRLLCSCSVRNSMADLGSSHVTGSAGSLSSQLREVGLKLTLPPRLLATPRYPRPVVLRRAEPLKLIDIVDHDPISQAVSQTVLSVPARCS